MKKISTLTTAVCLFLISNMHAFAHPVFAERHNMRCSACHVTPIVDGAPLNSNGRNFRNNGYKFGDNNGGGNNGGGNNDNCITFSNITICQ